MASYGRGQYPRTLKPLPVDWEVPIPFCGFTRNPTARAYFVYVSAGGKQHYVGLRDDQESAARLHDLALWRLCPKLRRRVKPNFPDDFESFCPADVAAQCPRLDRLYDALPFILATDEALAETELRRRHLSGQVESSTRGLAEYDAFRQQGHRAGVEMEARLFEFTSRSLKFEFSKLPGVVEGLRRAEELVGQAAEELRKTCALLDQHRDYYALQNQSKSTYEV